MTKYQMEQHLAQKARLEKLEISARKANKLIFWLAVVFLGFLVADVIEWIKWLPR